MPIRIFIDQGHNPSGPNAGAEGNGLREQDVNYLVGERLAQLLNRDPRFTARVSRTTPVERLGTSNATSLQARVNMANAWPADYFLSIHCNASTSNLKATGIYTAAYSASVPGWRLAQTLRQSMMAATGAGDMGTEARPDLAVLRTSKMPAALVECGFMSTPAELALLRDSAYQTKLARGIADGILSYLRG